jgi:hypothetical protein
MADGRRQRAILRQCGIDDDVGGDLERQGKGVITGQGKEFITE